MPGSNLKM